MRIWSITLRIAQRVRQKFKQCLQGVISIVKKWSEILSQTIAIAKNFPQKILLQKIPLQKILLQSLQKNHFNISQKVISFWHFLKRFFGSLRFGSLRNCQNPHKEWQENLPKNDTPKENLLNENPPQKNLQKYGFKNGKAYLKNCACYLIYKIQPYKQKFLKIFSTLFAYIFLWLKSICIAIFAPILLPILAHLSKIAFIQKLSQVLKRHYHRYRRKIFVKSARAIQNLKHIFYKTHFVALSFYVLCGILALFSAFLFGVKYGIEALLSPSKPSTFFASFIQSHLKSSLEKSSLALVPKDYLDTLKPQKAQITKEEQKSSANPVPKPTIPTAPIMPRLDESKNIFYGSFTFSHALSLAQNALLERDFVRARIWIYRAWDMQAGSKADSKKVWELYLQSYEEDALASMQEKEKAKAIFKNAQEYYGF